MPVIEISVDSLESARAAQAGGAQRLELCSGLREGGLTPSLGLLRAVRAQTSIGLYVLIRPRSGDFLYTDEEFRIMREDIAIAAQEGADGVVLGILDAEGDIDVSRTRELVTFARPMEVTFHRAFDMTRDPVASVQAAVGTGADRILTSGGAANAMSGRQRLAELVHTAGDQIGILVAGGVRPHNIAALMHATGAQEFHSAMRRSVPGPMRFRNPSLSLGDPGSDEYSRVQVAVEDVRLLVHEAQAAHTR